MNTNISIRNAKHAKIGLNDLIDYLEFKHDRWLNEMIMVEIGAYVGDSTAIFAQRIGTVYSVDPFVNGYDDNDSASYQFDMKIIECQFDVMAAGYENLNKMKMTSEEAASHFGPATLDMVYVDGVHTYEGVKKDILLWLPKIKRNGFLAGHDYKSKHFPGVTKAIDEFRTPDATFRDSSYLIMI